MMQLRNGKTIVTENRPRTRGRGMRLRNGVVKPTHVPEDTYDSPWTRHRDWHAPGSPYRALTLRC